MQPFRLQTVRQSSAPGMLPPARRVPIALAVGIAVAAALLTAAVLLWVSYGTVVFFELIAAGIAACF